MDPESIRTVGSGSELFSSAEGRSSGLRGPSAGQPSPIAAYVSVFLFAIGVSLGFGNPFPARAGPLEDFDGDLVPIGWDNCRSIANGPNQLLGSNQSDSDGDGYGNRCDTDFDQSGTTTSIDFARLLAAFGGSFCVALFPPPPECVVDLDGSGTITVSDFAIFLGRFSAPPGAPGPSGLVCARYSIRIDLGEAPCAP